MTICILNEYMYILIIQKKERLNEVYYVFCARNESTLFSNVLLKRRLVLRKMLCEPYPACLMARRVIELSAGVTN